MHVSRRNCSLSVSEDYLSKECGQINIIYRLFPLIHHHPFITVLSLVNVFTILYDLVTRKHQGTVE